MNRTNHNQRLPFIQIQNKTSNKIGRITDQNSKIYFTNNILDMIVDDNKIINNIKTVQISEVMNDQDVGNEEHCKTLKKALKEAIDENECVI